MLQPAMDNVVPEDLWICCTCRKYFDGKTFGILHRLWQKRATQLLSLCSSNSCCLSYNGVIDSITLALAVEGLQPFS